jgi:hypothetical protein
VGRSVERERVFGSVLGLLVGEDIHVDTSVPTEYIVLDIEVVLVDSGICME